MTAGYEAVYRKVIAATATAPAPLVPAPGREDVLPVA